MKVRRLLVAALFGASIAAAEVASCTDDCKGGRQWCVNACVDLNGDPGNCGTCGTPCGLASSCNNASCVPAGLTPDGGDASAPAQCAECLASSSAITSCSDALEACRADPSCFAWTACVTSCFGDRDSGACFDTCAVDAGAAASALVGPVVACACAVCSLPCAALCPSDGGMPDGSANDASASDAAPSDAAPSDAAPSDAAPSDAAPSDAAMP